MHACMTYVLTRLQMFTNDVHKKTDMQDRKSGIWNKNNYFINKDDISGKTVLFLNSQSQRSQIMIKYENMALIGIQCFTKKYLNLPLIYRNIEKTNDNALYIILRNNSS